MTAQQIKELLIKRFTWANGYVGAVYECSALSAADVIAVKFGGKVQEFEIKVSKADLVGEMKAARVAAGLLDIGGFTRKAVRLALDNDGIERTPEQLEMLINNGHTLSKTKLAKHRFYLDPEHKEDTRYPYSVTGWTQPKKFVPNTFYWCVPYTLLELCRELNQGLPYGIYCYDMPQTSKYYQKFIARPARSLRGQGDKLYFELFNRACTLWADDRSKLKREAEV